MLEKKHIARLFWHLPCLPNPHIRRVCCGLSNCEQLQNSSCSADSLDVGSVEIFYNVPVGSFGLCFVGELLLWRGVTVDWIVDEWVGCRIADF
jgi:hypothetical protein